MPRYDTILLDADNTLFDFDAAEHAALCRALEQLEQHIHQYRLTIQSGDREALSARLATSAARKRKMNHLEELSGAVGRDRA